MSWLINDLRLGERFLKKSNEIKRILKILTDRTPSVLFTWVVRHQEEMILDDDEGVQTGKRPGGFAGRTVHFHQQHQSLSEIISRFKRHPFRC